jgi:hypothetical protein
MVSNEGFRLQPGLGVQVPLAVVMPEEESGPTQKKEMKAVRKKQPPETANKKLDFEITAGLGFTDTGNLFDRAEGISTMMIQYADNYQVEPVINGEFTKNMFLVPLQAAVNYRLSPNWFLKGAVEFSFGSLSGEQTHSINWGGGNETHAHNLSTRINYLMPQVGVETRFGSFGIYGMVGFHFMQFSDTETYRLTDGAYTYNREDVTKASGGGFGLMLGGKYRFDLGGRIDMVVRLEAAYIGVGSLSGDRSTAAQDSDGRSFSESVSGTVYSFETDPFGHGWYSSWRLYGSAPTGDEFRSVEELSLSLYSLRLMVGIAF